MKFKCKENTINMKTNPPIPPLNRILYEFPITKTCPFCDSSLKLKWLFFSSKYCIQPKCENYYKKIGEEI